MEISQDKTASALAALGYKVFRNYKFHWESENTPDSSIAKNGKIHRWTDGWHGDLIDFIQLTKGVNFKKAKAIAEEQAHISFDKESLSNWIPPKTERKPPISKQYLHQYEVARQKHFKHYLELLKALMPSVKDWRKRKEVALKYKIGYIEKSKKLMLPIFDLDRSWITIGKYTNKPYEGLPKIMFTKERQKCPFNLSDMPEYRKTPDTWVLIAEGHKDVLNAVGNGFHAITPGGSGDLFREQDLPLFKGLKVLICGDYDKAGFVFNERIKAQMEGVAEKVKVIDWETICALRKMPAPHDGFDVTDFLERKPVKK